MSKINVSKGRKVSRISIIGVVGNTGKSTGTHLHWEIRKSCNCYGQVENPALYAGIPNKIGTYDSNNYKVDIDKKYKNGDIIKIKAQYTGSKTFAQYMIEIAQLNLQYWVDKSIYNPNTSELNLIVCDYQNGKLLVELSGQKQFWIDESDVIK